MFMGIGLFTSTSGIVAAWMLGDSFKTDAKKKWQSAKVKPANTLHPKKNSTLKANSAINLRDDTKQTRRRIFKML